MPGEQKRHGHDRGHHDHKTAKTGSVVRTKRPPSSSSNRRIATASKGNTGSITSLKSNEPQEVNKTSERNKLEKTADPEVVPITSLEPEVQVVENGEKSPEINDTPVQEQNTSPPEEKWAEKSEENEGFSIRSFNDNIMEFTEIFDSDKFKTVNQDYPVDDLIAVVSEISGTIEEFKKQTLASQNQLEGLREKMRQVKDNIHFSVSKNAIELQDDDENQSIEAKELKEKLARLNAEVAKANADLSDALRLSTETESSAVQAQIAAERAKEEAKRIEEEVELRAQVEARRKKEEEKRMEELRRQKEEEERREREERKAKEAEWKRKEGSGLERTAIWEKWPPCEIRIMSDSHDLGVGCLVRGNPSHFDQSKIALDVLDPKDCKLCYDSQEELVSCILRVAPKTESGSFQEPVYVAIPFLLSRSAAQSREAFIKAEVKGEWKELSTKEVTFDNHKDVKFVQAEVRGLTTMVVMTRFKRDYATLSKRPIKIVSSFDHRVTVSAPRDTFRGKELFRMQVQPVDSGTVNELQLRKPECKGLLTSSPIILTEWESSEFLNPVTITVPCPPNPAKARKLAQIRKLKEEKMKNPQRFIPPPADEKENKQKEKKSASKMLQQQQQQEQQEEESRHQTKWYMGEYAHNDDDENDLLYLVSRSASGKWTVQDVRIQQVKLDLLQFDLDHPLERFMVLRTRTNVQEDFVAPIACSIFDLLSKRLAQILVKQRSDDPFDTLVSIVPVAKTQKTVKRLSESGYDDGPDPSQVVNINEGDVIEISFRGNITNSKKDRPLTFIYNSNMKSEIGFYACEVDQYLQKNFSVYRGLIQIHRCFCVKPGKKVLKKQMSVDDMALSNIPETKKDLLCEISMNIPKYHIEPVFAPVKAPVTIVTTTDPVNDDMIRDVARDLGDEWKKIAVLLNVTRSRIQAILRDIQVYDKSDEDARYEMLMCWLKKMPKATDKVSVLSNALMRGGRADLAENVRAKGRDFRDKRISVH